MTAKIELTKAAKKGFEKAPIQAKAKFLAWSLAVEEQGLAKVRLQKGYHDEPLRGQLKGLRSIRLNDQWRAFYVVKADGLIELIEVTEINPHAYKK